VNPWIPEEFRDDLPGYAVDRFLQAGGGIMLMHDIHQNTADELPAVIAGLRAAGATFVEISDPNLFPLLDGSIQVPEPPACCNGIVD
jgi:peptidoglycan/xylan/chitin deacetylase (PgdA/CDA1 family)